MTRRFNFYGGPATLPLPVLEKAQAELLDWGGRGLSVMEISHRSQAFVDLMEGAEAKLRQLLAIPHHYKVLFITSCAREQYALLPMNILGDKKAADYLETGFWSSLAHKEGQRYCDARLVCSSREEAYHSIPDPKSWTLNPDAAFVHYTTNETIHGVQFPFVPEVGDVPLTADMTSDLLSKPVDIERFGVIFAGAQKNVAPSGMTIVIIREDLLGRALPITPSMCNYQVLAEQKSLLYTSAMFSCYMADLMFDWLLSQGGMTAIAKHNQLKAQCLYEVLDNNDYYQSRVDKRYRSLMNVPFYLQDESKTSVFLEEAEKHNIVGLKGHRMVGGIRASIYNAQTMEAVYALRDFMTDFVKRHG